MMSAKFALLFPLADSFSLRRPLLTDTPPKNPIVFCHGVSNFIELGKLISLLIADRHTAVPSQLFGFDILGPASLPPLQISHWRGIREILEANGSEVFITRVPATSSIEERATILKKSIEERFEGRSVNLIGHSMVGPVFARLSGFRLVACLADSSVCVC